MRTDPLAQFFHQRWTSPPGWRRPSTPTPLFGFATGTLPSSAIHHLPSTDYITPSVRYWTEFVKHDDEAREWLLSPHSFTAPEHWPTEVRELLPDYFDPMLFACTFMPKLHKNDYDDGRIPAVLEDLSLSYLAAYAHGWPASPHHQKMMLYEAAQLLQHPVMLIWLYNLDLSAVPIPFSKTSSIATRIRSRQYLEQNPLLVTKFTFQRAVPETLHDPYMLLRFCPSRFGVGPGERRPLLRDNPQNRYVPIPEGYPRVVYEP